VLARARTGSFADLRAEEPYEGLRRRSFDSDSTTISEYIFSPGARFPRHRHPQEQITLVQQGHVDMILAGETKRLRAGDWSILGPNVEHGIVAGSEGAHILAIVVPRRASDSVTVTE
jgi:quercetin dioxygenase-like cupin family protein